MATVAKVYARALFEVAQEKKLTEQVLTELSEFVETSKRSSSLLALLSGKGIDPGVRQSVLKEVMSSAGLSGLSARFLDLLVTRNRASALSEIVAEFAAMVDSARGVVAGELRSAIELSNEEVSVLSAALAKKVGASVKLKTSVDPSLLGGVVAVVGGKTFDASLKTQLERFKNELI